MKYSKNQIEKAGFDLVKSDLSKDQDLLVSAMDVLTYWRDSHISALDNCDNLLKENVKRADKNAFIAKRIKRTESIVKKLRRFKRMSLKNMQDIAGIRVVLENNNKVKQLFYILSKSEPFLINEQLRFKDYIKNPKEDGYRGIHLIGKFRNHEKEFCCVEVQIRTRLQHCWATSLEIIDLFTQQNLKLNEGKLEWHQFFKFVSNQFAILENLRGFNSNKQAEMVSQYISYVKKKENIHLLKEIMYITRFVNNQILGTTYTIETLFQEYAKSLHRIDKQINNEKNKQGYILLRLNVVSGNLETEFFEKDKYSDATKMYSLYETTLANNKSWVVALVSSNAVGGIKEAYPNYFADSEVFWSYISLIKYAAVLGYHNLVVEQKVS